MVSTLLIGLQSRGYERLHLDQRGIMMDHAIVETL